MNRRQRRAAEKLERATGAVAVPPDMLENLIAAQRFFLAIVRAQGRIRVKDEDMKGLKEGDRVRSRKDAGGVVLSFQGAEAPDPEEEPEPATVPKPPVGIVTP